MTIRFTATELPKKTSNQAWRRCLLPGRKGSLFVTLFFKTPQRGNISRNYSYLYTCSLLFQSMKNKWKSQAKGGVDFILLSLSTSPQPTPPFYALPQLLDSSLPLNPACFGQSRRAVVWVGWNLLVDIVALFIFSIMSLVTDVHMCCPCVYPERWTWFCYVAFQYIFFFFWVRAEQWKQSNGA